MARSGERSMTAGQAKKTEEGKVDRKFTGRFGEELKDKGVV